MSSPYKIGHGGPLKTRLIHHKNKSDQIISLWNFLTLIGRKFNMFSHYVYVRLKIT